MNFAWLTWTNPVAVWWIFLVSVSAANIALWFALYRRFRGQPIDVSAGILRVELMLFLCAAYVFGCAFRSVLPRADVQRMALFDTWLSSVAVGRSVATIAEVCFVIQWAIVLRQLAVMTRSDTVRNVSSLVAPPVVIAECCSWYAVLTTNYFGNAVENSLWAVSFGLIALALVRLLFSFRGPVRAAIALSLAGVACYIAFLGAVDVPMYLARWHDDSANAKPLFDIFAGLHDASTRWTVTHDPAQWREEMVWMGLYFSFAVWASLALASFPMLKPHLLRYRQLRARPRRMESGLPVPT